MPRRDPINELFEKTALQCRQLQLPLPHKLSLEFEKCSVLNKLSHNGTYFSSSAKNTSVLCAVKDYPDKKNRIILCMSIVPIVVLL